MGKLGFSWRCAIAAAALSLGWARPAAAQDPIAELQAQFNRETDPVRKAKTLTRLGDAQLDLANKETDAGNFAQALKILQEYGDEVKVAHAALKASGIDAERKPNGFKQLQMHVRKAIREIDQTTLAVPVEQRKPFEATRQELLHIEKELIDMLFPRPHEKLKSPKQKG